MILDKKTIRSILLIVFSAILFFFFLWNISLFWKALLGIVGLLLPLLIGLCIAFVLKPLVSLPEVPLLNWGKKHLPPAVRCFWPAICRTLGIVFALAVVSGGLSLLVFTIFPEVSATLNGFARNISKYTAQLNEWLEQVPAVLSFLEDLPLEQLELDWKEILSTMSSFLKNGAGSMLSGMVNATMSLIGGVWNVIFGLIIGIYVLAQREQIGRFVSRFIRAYLPEKRTDRIFYVAHVANEAFSNFVSGQLLEALVIGVLCYFGMTIFRFPYALTIATTVGFTALSPVFGAWIGAIFGAVMILTVSPMQALWFLIFLIVLQQLEGNLIYPRVVGHTMGLPGLLVMLAVWIGGSLSGITGMLFSVPLTSVAYTLVKESMAKRLEAKEKKSAGSA